ncbi:MAG: 3-oxoacyl-ACP reductase FabG [Candidatus Nanoarchaeia archaeon]|nr:3-oxoacyl-ACP reductase FabG [Candidatus Nanoarchaeia archaeon]
MELRDKVILVTGSSRGIGKEIALLFAKNGSKVVVNYHISNFEPDADKNAKKVVDQIKKNGSEAIALECDVSKEEQVRRMVEKVIETYKKIDILVNNAGIVYDIPCFKKTIEQWRETLNINLIGTFLCSKYVTKYMKQGRIINISSTNGINSFCPESMDYDASKAGIIILTRDLAKQLAPNILVNSIAPGWVNTNMNKNLPKKVVREEENKIYLKRFAEPEEIAKVALFLASDESSYITGTTIIVDGGYG